MSDGRVWSEQSILGAPTSASLRMEPTLEQMARLPAESGDYRVTSRLELQTEYRAPDANPKLVAAVVDVETTGTNPRSNKWYTI